MLEFLQTWSQGHGVSEDLAFYFARGVIATAVLILSVTAHFVAKRYVLSSISYVISKSKLKWDDAILRQGALNRLTYLVPAIVIYVLTPFALEGMETTIDVIRGATQIYMLIILMLVAGFVAQHRRGNLQEFPGIQRGSNQGFYPNLKNRAVLSDSRLCNFNPPEQNTIVPAEWDRCPHGGINADIPGCNSWFCGGHPTGREQDDFKR